MDNWQLQLKQEKKGEVINDQPIWYHQLPEIDRLTADLNFLLKQLPLVRKTHNQEAYLSYLKKVSDALLQQYLVRMRIVELSGKEKVEISKELEALAVDYKTNLLKIVDLLDYGQTAN